MNDFLKGALAAAVPLKIVELKQRRGPGEADRAEAGIIINTLNVKELGRLGPNTQDDQARQRFERLAHALAVLSFDKGGVIFLGTRHESVITEDTV